MPESSEPIVALCDGWPAEWEVVPADRGANVFRIDRDGHWYHEGVRITHPGLVRAFAGHVVRRPENGALVLRWGPHDHPLTVADTAVVLHHVQRPDPATGQFRAQLVDGRVMFLDAGRLRVGARNVLYGTLPDGEPARFSRAAYYQMAAWIVEVRGGFAVAVGERQWRLDTGESS